MHVSVCAPDGEISFSRAYDEIDEDPAKQWSALLAALAG